MKITGLKSKTERTYTLDVEDGPLLSQPYSRSGRQFRLTRVVAVKRDGNWVSAEPSGPVLKKDGSDSQNWANYHIYGAHPDWLAELLKGLA